MLIAKNNNFSDFCSQIYSHLEIMLVTEASRIVEDWRTARTNDVCCTKINVA